MLMMDHEWELDRAKRAYLTLDRSANEVDGKKTQVFVVEDDVPDADSHQDDET